MIPLFKGELVFTRHGAPALVLQEYCDGTVCIEITATGQVLHVDRRWVSTLEEGFQRERTSAIETVALVCASLLGGVIAALAFLQ